MKTSGRVDGFEQTPDRVVPSLADPQVVIECKFGEDDGTCAKAIARTKVLRAEADTIVRAGGARRIIVAVVDGRGFRVRDEDIKALWRNCDGGVYTLALLDRMIAASGPLYRFVGTASVDR